MRTKKTVDGVVTEYVWLGDMLIIEQTGTNVTYYLYDENGSVIGFEYNGTPYYYLKNIQGDVVSIVDNSGVVVVNYTYNAWGEIISISGTMADTIGVVNKLRYRSYYYDSETGFYYLQSRYYDPVVKRFISPDSTDYLTENGDFDGYNLYAYCVNNPVMYVDKNGTDAVLLIYKDRARGFGHMGALIQYSSGRWYYFSWGFPSRALANVMAGNNNIAFCQLDKLYVKGITRYNIREKLMLADTYTGNFLSTSSITYSHGLTDYIYIKGDFYRTYRYYLSLYMQHKQILGKRYNLFKYNCMHATLDGLLWGTFSKYDAYNKAYIEGITKHIPIPNTVFYLLKCSLLF